MSRSDNYTPGAGGLAPQPLRRRFTMTEHYPVPPAAPMPQQPWEPPPGFGAGQPKGTGYSVNVPRVPLQFPSTVDGGHNWGGGMTPMPGGSGAGLGFGGVRGGFAQGIQRLRAAGKGPPITYFGLPAPGHPPAGKGAPSIPSTIAAAGRYGDTQLAHVNPEEGQVLKAMGGSGTVNPETGLREYFDTSQMPRSQNVVTAQPQTPGGVSEPPPPSETQNQDLMAGTDPNAYQKFGLTAPQIPEHMIDPLLNSIHTMGPQQVRLAAPALMGALIKRHMKMASMQRFQPPRLPLPQPLPQPQPQRRQRSSIQPRGYGGIRG